ncbi:MULTISPECIES: hypothetical protein [unclassified Streptomyces]|uniref:hypothetical protein n=1 Tax=Streptomyces TaxID=1883 RepID=UPI000A46E543|nr:MULTISPECIES: hypothetical protein [unclassified Streptomyces]WTC69751.1 hypothetical protein OG882_05155 [Streptomyces anulatus]
MTDLDTILAAGQALAAVHGAVDQTINAVLYYGPGAVLAAAAYTAWRTGQWALRRYDQMLHDRADRRKHTARAYRLCRVADNADAIGALTEIDLITYLDNKYAATPDLAPEEGR